jgi:hypothetical protein
LARWWVENRETICADICHFFPGYRWEDIERLSVFRVMQLHKQAARIAAMYRNR